MVRRITSFIDVEFEWPFSQIVQAISAVANMAIDAVPTVACIGGGGFRSRLIAKVVTPLVLIGMVRNQSGCFRHECSPPPFPVASSASR